MKSLYTSVCNRMILAFFIAASCISQTVCYSSDDDGGQAVDDVAKSSLGMLRLARGLQMLRLGKRLPDGLADSKRDALRELVRALISKPRDETRRQPPVPRYGRDLDSSLEEPAGDVYYPEVYRPAPRVGRYRRANASPLSHLFLEQQHHSPLSLRTVVRPRIGRYLEGVVAPEDKTQSHPQSRIQGGSTSDDVLTL